MRKEKNNKNEWKRWVAITGIVIALCGGMVGYGRLQAQSSLQKEAIEENKKQIEKIFSTLIKIEKKLERIDEKIVWIKQSIIKQKIRK